MREQFPLYTTTSKGVKNVFENVQIEPDNKKYAK